MAETQEPEGCKGPPQGSLGGGPRGARCVSSAWLPLLLPLWHDLVRAQAVVLSEGSKGSDVNKVLWARESGEQPQRVPGRH